MEQEDEGKTLNFLDVTIKNNMIGKYEFEVHRKNAITNVQVKKHSNHLKDLLIEHLLFVEKNILRKNYNF